MSDTTPHSFIVKVWIEETAQEAGQATWRGHITHVPGGERRYLQELQEIPIFIKPYLEALGVQFSSSGSLNSGPNNPRIN
jgi:hypothetical protein